MISGLWNKAVNILKKDGVIVAPTDTIYGVIASAHYKKAVSRIYKLKGRDENKPFIILVSSFTQIIKLGIFLSEEQKEFLDKVWPGQISVVLSCSQKKLSYLHRGTNTIAFRMIGKKNKNLFNLINKVGPLVAPSANPQGLQPAKNINEAKMYFGDKIDLYINSGSRVAKPSTLVKYTNHKLIVLRKGAVKI
ncbi:MAG: threonylcarbamoyl-AMP synthase [Patescibacteria group bacterium]|nr:threonylcarbamoyl-AMP synthase [Patescibacteria group bacterium]